jgi:adenine-specific DNA-methyltransferase
MFFPIYVDEVAKMVVRAGPPIPLEEAPNFTPVDGLRPIWPIDSNNDHRRWRWGFERMQKLIADGEIRLGTYNAKRDSWAINRVQPRKATHRKLKTVWRHTSHNAGSHGAGLLERFLGQGQAFTFPKSLYATRDCLAAVCRDRPDALIVDFFAGSGTTLHATLLMNHADGGNRRCLLVTNNEVEDRLAKGLHKDGLYPGDPDYDRHGIFDAVCKPRVEAAITGRRPDGQPVSGKYLDGRSYSEGFAARCSFFQLDYVEPDDVELGQQFAAVVPILWLASGAVGPRPDPKPQDGYLMPPKSSFAVLLRESSFRKFLAALEKRANITHVWLVTDSERAFADMRSVLPEDYIVGMLYRDYLRNFAINAGQGR